MEHRVVIVKGEGRGGSRREAGLAIKGLSEGSFGDGVMRCLDCVHVSILVMIFDFGFVKRCHWRKLSKGYVGLLCITSYRYMCIYIYLKTKHAI